MSLRKLVSLTALVCFLLLILTSIVLFIVPAGRVAFWSGWRLWLLGKEQWAAVHLNLGVLLLVMMVLHVWLNWAALVSYLKRRARGLKWLSPEFAAALILSLLVCSGTLADVPPFGSLLFRLVVFKFYSAQRAFPCVAMPSDYFRRYKIATNPRINFYRRPAERARFQLHRSASLFLWSFSSHSDTLPV